MSEILGLVQVGNECDYSLDDLSGPICDRFPWLKVQICSPLQNIQEAYDSGRGQYHSTRILASLEADLPSLKAERILGVAAVDLYVPGMNFVFGEARLPGRVGLISTYRLKTRSRNETALFEQRVVKEAVHELGHTLGLKHCTDKLCVMHFSVRLADTDVKKADLCRDCSSELEKMRIEI